MSTCKRAGMVGILVLMTGAWLASPAWAEEKRTLPMVEYVPGDAFLYVAGWHNAERAFLEQYWNDVFAALHKCGIGGDAMRLLGSMIGAEQMAEVERLQARAIELVGAVDWHQLVGGEFAFVERMSKPAQVSSANLVIGPPEMVWFCRGPKAGSEANYRALTAILDGIVDEVNKASGAETLRVERKSEEGIEQARLNLLAMVPEAPQMALAVARRDDLIFITFGQSICDDVCALMNGRGRALASDPRLKAAFAQLPPAEDGAVFFDVRNMVTSLGGLFTRALQSEARPGDVIRNTGGNAEAKEHTAKAIEAYGRGDIKAALVATEAAHQADPTDSIALYNLACFHALLGHQAESLSWLQKAVDAGFYAPEKIAADSDLESLRSEPAFTSAVTAAREAAARYAAEHPKGEIEGARMIMERILDVGRMFDYIATVESTEGYTTHTHTVAALADDARGKPLYEAVCQPDQSMPFDRFLPRETRSFSLGGGIDLSALYTFVEDSIRQLGATGEQILAQWEGVQQQFGVNVRKDVLAWIDGGSVTVTLDDDLGSVWLLKVKDEKLAREKTAAAVEFMSTQMSEFAAKNPMLAMLAVQTSPALDDRLEGFENLHIAAAPKPIIWGVAESHLIFGTSAEAVALCLETAHGKHASIRENERAMQEALVPTGPFSQVSLTDQRQLGQELSAALGMVSMFSGMAGAFIPDQDARVLVTRIANMLAKLTPVVEKIDFHKSTASHTTFDGKAWHTHAVTHYFSPAEREERGHPEGQRTVLIQ